MRTLLSSCAPLLRTTAENKPDTVRVSSDASLFRVKSSCPVCVNTPPFLFTVCLVSSKGLHRPEKRQKCSDRAKPRTRGFDPIRSWPFHPQKRDRRSDRDPRNRPDQMTYQCFMSIPHAHEAYRPRSIL